MYLTAFEAFEPADLRLVKSVFEDIRADRKLAANDADEIARDLINLWLAGFRDPDEMKGMLTPPLIER